MIFIGLDPSLAAFGVVTHYGGCSRGLPLRFGGDQPDPGRYEAATLKTEPAKTAYDRAWRCDAMIGKLAPFFEDVDQIGGVAIEAYVMAMPNRKNPQSGEMEATSGIQSVVHRAELGGILRHWLICDLQLPVIEVHQSTVKKFATGTGRAGKENVAVALAKRYGVELADNNQYDAYALARIAACYWGAEEPATVAQREVIETLRGN